MKPHKITYFIKSALLVTVAAMVLTGCSTEYKAYTGPTLPPDQTATLKVPWRNGPAGFAGTTYLWMSAIDGKTRHGLGGSDTSIKLLPGKHTISFLYIKAGAGGSGSPCVKEINVEAGQTYTAVLHEHLSPGSISANVQPIYSGSHMTGTATTIKTSTVNDFDWDVEIKSEK